MVFDRYSTYPPINRVARGRCGDSRTEESNIYKIKFRWSALSCQPQRSGFSLRHPSACQLPDSLPIGRFHFVPFHYFVFTHLIVHPGWKTQKSRKTILFNCFTASLKAMIPFWFREIEHSNESVCFLSSFDHFPVHSPFGFSHYQTKRQTNPLCEFVRPVSSNQCSQWSTISNLLTISLYRDDPSLSINKV